MPADDFYVYERNGTYRLHVRDHGDDIELDDESMQKLARIGMALADVGSQEPLIPPYVVEVVLPYSDFDTDQATTAYYWACRTNTRELADSIREACDRELARTSAFVHMKSYILPYPERTHFVDQLDEVTSVVAAVASLRQQLLAHQSNAISDSSERTYWYASGFTVDETYLVYAAFGDGLCEDVHPDSCAGRVVEVIDDTLADNPDHYDDHDRAALAKLRRWALGEDLTDAAANARGAT